MYEGELPDKVYYIETIRINRNMDKRCKCTDRTFVVDPHNRSVYCGKCGAWIEPYEAIEEIATYYERLNDEVERLLEQRRQIMNYKPWLLIFRQLEKAYRSKKMLPCCPNCNQAFYFEEIKCWTNRKMEELRRIKS